MARGRKLDHSDHLRDRLLERLAGDSRCDLLGGMDDFELDHESQQRLDDYFSSIGDVLELDERRASFAVYAMGLIGEGDRKSMEPIAARADPRPHLIKQAAGQHTPTFLDPKKYQHHLYNKHWRTQPVFMHYLMSHGVCDQYEKDALRVISELRRA